MKKIFNLLLLTLALSPLAMAQTWPTGWQTDTDGSVTGIEGEEYVFITEENFPCPIMRQAVQDFRVRINTGNSTSSYTYNYFETYNVTIDGTSVRILTKTGASKPNNPVPGNENLRNEFPDTRYRTTVTSLKGVEYLVGMTYFNLDDNKALTDTKVDLSKNANLWRVRCAKGVITELVLPENGSVTYLDCSDNYHLRTIDASRIPNITQLQIGRCFFEKEFYMSGHPYLKTFTCQGTGKTGIDVHGDADLVDLKFQGNHVLSVDLSYINHSLTGFNCHDQTADVDVTVINREKVGIYFKNGVEVDRVTNLTFDGNHGHIHKETIDGKDYYIIATTTDDGWKRDLDIFGDKMSYVYDHRLPAEYDPNGGAYNSTMNVTLTLYPYVMYVNPATKSGSSDFYSGTLYLDYASVVPVGCEAYVATGIKDEASIVYRPESVAASQLVLKKLGGAGTIIPANTPIYVKAATESGLYAFDRAWSSYPTAFSNNVYTYEPLYFTTDDMNPATGENYTMADPELLAQNILRGTLTEQNFGAMMVLTLGRENSNGGGSGEVGFWRNRSGKVGAHRCYIPADVLSSTSSAGATFLFSDEEAATLNIGETEYATYYNSSATIVPTGVEAAVVTATSSDQLHIDWRYTGGDVLPGGTAVILRGPAGTSFNVTSTEDETPAPTDNLLQGSDTETTTTGNGLHYKLSTNTSGRLGFYFGAPYGAPFTSAAHKAWLVVPAESAVRGYFLNDDTATSVATPVVSSAKVGCYYDLQGRRVLQPRKGGVYVGSDGRKTLIR